MLTIMPTLPTKKVSQKYTQKKMQRKSKWFPTKKEITQTQNKALKED